MANTDVVTKRESLPAHLADHETFGLDMLSDFVTPPRAKVVQRQSDAMLEKGFDPGDIVAVPLNVPIAPIEKDGKGKAQKKGVFFHVVPLFFYPEWILWNPIETKGTLDAIKARSLDPKSEIAIRSRDANTRTVICPDLPSKDGKPIHCRYVEHLTFISTIVDEDHALYGMPIAFSFQRASHSAGRNWAALIRMKNAPVCGCNYAVQSVYQSNAQGQWFQPEVTNPVLMSPYVQDPDKFTLFKSLHEDFKKAYEQNRLQVDHDDSEISAAPASSNEF